MRYIVKNNMATTKGDRAGMKHISSILREMGYKGSVRCPVCGAVGSCQDSVDRHIIRESWRDNEHFKMKHLAVKRLIKAGGK